MSDPPPVASSPFLTQLAIFVLVAVIAMNLPGALCMGLDIDTTAFDLYLRGMQEGRVLYQDMIENNLPGVMWVHAITRSLFGWSSVAIQAVDLTMLGTAFFLIGFFPRGVSLAARLWITTFLFCFYFSASEWAHCQRDPWTLLPLIGALYLRRWQSERNAAGRPTTPASLLGGLFEGMLWGLGIWIKPYVGVPAVLVWLASVYWSRRRGVPTARILLDTGVLLAGGLLCGYLGIRWMQAHGCWEPYLEHMRNLRQHYFNADMYHPFTILDYRVAQFLVAYPFSLLALGALAFAAVAILLTIFRAPQASERNDSTLSTLLFATLLVGYGLQGFTLQHAFDYVLTPVYLLGLAWAGMSVARSRSPRERFGLGVLCFSIAFIGHVPILQQRLPIWERCIREGPTPEIKDRLMILRRTEWNSLQKVRAFLETQNVKDGELTVFVEGGLPLFEEMGLRPTTRSYMMTNQLASLPYRRQEIFDELRAGKQRFVFTSTRYLNRLREDLDEVPTTEGEPLPKYWFRSRDWTHFIVFRSGMYIVMEIPPELMSDWCFDCLGL